MGGFAVSFLKKVVQVRPPQAVSCSMTSSRPPYAVIDASFFASPSPSHSLGASGGVPPADRLDALPCELRESIFAQLSPSSLDALARAGDRQAAAAPAWRACSAQRQPSADCDAALPESLLRPCLVRQSRRGHQPVSG